MLALVQNSTLSSIEVSKTTKYLGEESEDLEREGRRVNNFSTRVMMDGFDNG